MVVFMGCNCKKALIGNKSGEDPSTFKSAGRRQKEEERSVKRCNVIGTYLEGSQRILFYKSEIKIFLEEKKLSVNLARGD